MPDTIITHLNKEKIMDVLHFIKNTIVCFILLFIPLDSLACKKKTLHKVQKKIEKTLIKEDVKKFYLEDSELKILMESEWWKKFPCSKNDTIIVFLSTCEGVNSVEIFNKSNSLCYNDANKSFFLKESLSDYEKFRIHLFLSWDKNLFKRIESQINCKLECDYEVFFRFDLSERKIKMDFCGFVDVDSPIMEEWFTKSKTLQSKDGLDIENYLDYLKKEGELF